MSIYSFFPMKKRKICKTPSGPATRRRTSSSTLGKLKKSLDGSAPSIGDNGIEIMWDNNSPSPTTTIALAGKRRRRQNVTQGEENGVTDLSFVVQKFSENNSPVADHTHSALLEMWCDKADQNNDNICEEEFTSPPFQTRHEKTKSPLSTPLNQRRTSKRISRKASRQFMLQLEIRKLVDEIQKSDLSSCSSQSQKEIKIEDQARAKRAKKNAETSTNKVTLLKQSLTNGEKPCNASPSVPGTTKSDRLLEDSFEWTEDDMDELILTCQLSSSGKGSLTAPEPPRPQFGSSPSEIFVPETQMSQTQEITQLNTSNLAEKSEHAQEVQTDKWAINFDADDSLLASAVQEFELSQEAIPKTKILPKKENSCKNNGENAFSFEKPSKTCPLTTTRNSSHITKNSKECFSKKPNENSMKAGTLSKKSDPKTMIVEKVSDVSKPFTTAAQTNTRSLSEKGNTARHLSKNTTHALGGKIIEPRAKEVVGISDVSKQLSEIPTTTRTKSISLPQREYTAEISCGKKIDPKVKEAADSKEFGRVPTTQANARNLPERGNGRRQYTTDILCGKKIEPNVKETGGNSSDVSKQFSKMPTQTNSKKLSEKGNSASEFTTDISFGNVCSLSTPRERAKAKLSLRRSTPAGNKASMSCENPSRTNENCCPRNNMRTQPRANEGSSSPLRSIPGNLSYKQSRPQTTFEVVPRPPLRKESKSSVKQTKKEQSNEFDFLLCEDNFAALLEEFNFDDVPTIAPKQAPAKTANNSLKSCSDNSAPSVGTASEKKTTYSKDEIERKRLEAQQRRLAKQKTTTRSKTRISKR